MTNKQKVIFISAFLLTSFSLTALFQIPSSLKKERRIADAYKALSFWNDSRSYPGKEIPSKGYYEAFARAKQMMNKNSLSGEDKWQEIGPHNFGGRTISLAINPLNSQTIYAGSASGGLWRSFTGGVGASAWQYIKTGFPVLGVGAIAIDISDTNKIYIGTGEVYQYGNSIGGIAERPTRGSYGIGILKTTDGGITWSKSLDWTAQQERGVQVIKISPADPNIVWAGTTDGVFKSTNAGSTWEISYDIAMVTDLAITPGNADKIYFTAGNFATTGFGCYRSTNDGDSWEKITTGWPAYYEGKALLSICESKPNTIYASIGGDYSGALGTWLCKTTNGGDNWTVVSTNNYASYQGWFSHFVVAHPNDPDKILCAGIDVWKSINGGKTLIQKSFWDNWYFGKTPVGGPEGPDDYSHADHHCFAQDPWDPDVVYFGNDGGVFRTTDFGNTFVGLNGGYQTMQFYGGFSISHENPNFCMGGLQDNGSVIYDGEPAWFRCIGGDGAWTGINQSDNNILYGSWQNLSMVKSTDRGETWNIISPPVNGETAFAAPFLVSMVNPNIIYAARSIVYISTDGGEGWRTTNNGNEVTSNRPTTMAMSFLNSSKVYLAGAPTSKRADVYRTTDRGDNWTDITGILPDRYPMDIEVDLLDDNKVYIVFSGYGTSHVFKSTNSGDTWIDIGIGLPDVPTQAIAVDPEHTDCIYIGNDLGVFVSTDGGGSWNNFSEGLPDAVLVYNISISMAARKIKIASHGNGAFERDLFDPATSVDDKNTIPADFILEQNYPNPFNPTTNISYSIPAVETGHAPSLQNVTLKIYDALGKEVTTLVNESQTPGYHQVTFDARSYGGTGLSSGVYFYRIAIHSDKLQAGDFSSVKKFVLMK